MKSDYKLEWTNEDQPEDVVEGGGQEGGAGDGAQPGETDSAEHGQVHRIQPSLQLLQK